MKMMMDEGEILRDYENAKHKFRQVSILADQNMCTNREMAEWLHDHGCEVDGRFLRKKLTREEKEQQKERITAMETQEEPPVETRAELPRTENEFQKRDSITGQKHASKDDAGKPRLTLVPMQIVFDIAAIREYGNAKYGSPDNWKSVEPERYREAAFRHFMRYIDDPTGVDDESGLPHRWHLECNLAFLAELECGLFKDIKYPGGIGNESRID